MIVDTIHLSENNQYLITNVILTIVKVRLDDISQSGANVWPDIFTVTESRSEYFRNSFECWDDIDGSLTESW